MLRRCLTWLRATWVVKVLPLDQNILLHQIVGYAIFIYSLVHTTAHVVNFGNLLYLSLFRHLLLLQEQIYSCFCCSLEREEKTSTDFIRIADIISKETFGTKHCMIVIICVNVHFL